MAQAVFALSEDGKSASQVKSAYGYAKTAHDGLKSDAKVGQFFNSVKQKYDLVLAEEKKEAEEKLKAKAEAKKLEDEEKMKNMSKTEQKLLSRVKLGEDEDE